MGTNSRVSATIRCAAASAGILLGCSAGNNDNNTPGAAGGTEPGLGGNAGLGGTLASGGSTSASGTPGKGGATASSGGATTAGVTGAGGVVTGAGGGTSGATGVGGTTGNGGGGGAGNGGSAGQGGGTGTGGASGPAGAVVWSKNVRLNDDTGTGRQTEVALAAGPDGLVLAGWMDERATRVCAYSFSTDGGLTWSKNVSIPNSQGSFVGDPSVAIDGGGTMYAVCQQYINAGSTGAIRLMTSKDKGASWSSIQTIQSAPDKPWAGGGTAQGTLFVSWLGNPGGIKRSTDGGMTWGPVQSTGNIVHGTAIVTSNTGLVHVPYNLDSSRNQLRYLRSKDNGSTWETPRDLLPDMGTFCFSCNPRQHPIVGAGADPTGKYVAITWASKMTGGQGDDDVWLIYSKDGGDTWSKTIKVNDNPTASRQFESWVAVDAHGRVHVAWTDYRDGGQNETWYARSDDPTMGFEKNIQVTDGHGSGSTDFLGDYKGIAVQGADVLVVWQDTRRDSGDIFFSRAAGAAGP